MTEYEQLLRELKHYPDVLRELEDRWGKRAHALRAESESEAFAMRATGLHARVVTNAAAATVAFNLSKGQTREQDPGFTVGPAMAVASMTSCHDTKNRLEYPREYAVAVEAEERLLAEEVREAIGKIRKFHKGQLVEVDFVDTETTALYIGPATFDHYLNADADGKWKLAQEVEPQCVVHLPGEKRDSCFPVRCVFTHAQASKKELAKTIGEMANEQLRKRKAQNQMEDSVRENNYLKKDAELRLKWQELRIQEASKRLEQEYLKAEMIRNQLAYLNMTQSKERTE